MDRDFWLERWKNNEIGFHQIAANPLLVEYVNALSLPNNGRIFLPLCGKTLDIAWLLSQGYRVVGVELSQLAIEQLFKELGVTPAIQRLANIEHYSAEHIDMYVGDLFELSANTLGPVDAVYDRAALVALPLAMRQKYSAHLVDITCGAAQLLITFEYDQRLMDGPPFSVSNEDVAQHYQSRYELILLKSQSVPGGLKGRWAATESVWLLKA